MKKRLIVALGCFGLVCAGNPALAPAMSPDPQEPPPALVVLLSVDQMRADYIDRFDHEFRSGFRRLIDGGAYFTNAKHDHAFTATAPGHATLVTGVHPSRHGIVSNDWWDRTELRRVYAVEDQDASILGFPDLSGRSPKTMLVPAVGDWLKSASRESKVVSVAIKDRVAILMGGSQSDATYWYEYQSGRYVTSTFYADEYPEWITHFNDSGPARAYVGTSWERLLPEAEYDESREDDFAAEAGGGDTSFPHKIAGSEDGESSAFEELANTPFGDAITFDLAKMAIEQLALGADAVPDFLAIGASSADLIGHRYGAFSQEAQDYYLRLDRELGELLEFLDDQVGEGRWRLVLSSDHGVATMPEESTRRGIDARRLGTVDFQSELIAGITAGLHAGQIFAQPSVSLIFPLGVVTSFGGEEVLAEQSRLFREAATAEVLKSEYVSSAFTYDQLLAGVPVGNPGNYRLLRNSFHPNRAADFVLQHPANYVYPDAIPASHGSVYDYDSRVPLIIYGTGVKTRIDRAVRTVDVAPTLAVLLGLIPPDGLDGEVLAEFRP